MKHDIRIALVICRSMVGDTKGNLSRMEEWTAFAKHEGAEIVCFPELSATGYHVKEQIKNNAETIPGYSSGRIADIAKKQDTCILAGIAEKKDGNIYASHVLAQPEDGISGLYRKLHLGPPEKEIFTPGMQSPCLFESRGLKLGIQLCYDSHFPELSTGMALKGADIIFIPHASPGASSDKKLSSWMRHLPARAFDNGVYVAAVNAAGDNGCGLSFPGTALLLSPEGGILQQYAGGDETIVIANLSAQTLESVRRHPMKYFLPNRRPEVYV